MKLIIALIVASLCVGCSPKPHVDISNESKYQSVVGQKYETLADLKIHGISLGINGDWRVNYVYITHPLGIGGNHVKFYDDLASNQKFEVVGVAKSAYSSIFGLYYKVKFLNYSKYNQYQILVDVENDVSTPNKGLDKNVFKLLPNNA